MSTTITAGNATNNGASISSDTAGTLQLQTGSTPTTAITIDGSQNVGIGTASPVQKLSVSTASTSAVEIISTGGTAQLMLQSSGTNPAYINYNRAAAGSLAFYDANAATERMRIDSSGNLLVGTTSSTAPNAGLSVYTQGAGNTQAIIGHSTSSGSGQAYCAFLYNAGQIGSITQNGTTAVAYNTTSDYRLKADVTPIQNGLSAINALKPVNFNWVDGRNDDGFLAHELQAVIPNCVTGEKDAVDEDGKPIYQQMDNSGVIPFLVKAIQELNAKVEALEAQLGAK